MIALSLLGISTNTVPPAPPPSGNRTMGSRRPRSGTSGRTSCTLYICPCTDRHQHDKFETTDRLLRYPESWGRRHSIMNMLDLRNGLGQVFGLSVSGGCRISTSGKYCLSLSKGRLGCFPSKHSHSRIFDQQQIVRRLFEFNAILALPHLGASQNKGNHGLVLSNGTNI